jgi:hypothetical protein
VNLWWAWDEKSLEGDGANLIMDGVTTGLGRPMPARAELGVSQTDAREHTLQVYMLLGTSLSGGKVHHQEPLHLVFGLMAWQRMQLNRDSGLLVGELASLWHCPLLDSGLSSAGLRLLPLMISMMSLKTEANF